LKKQEENQQQRVCQPEKYEFEGEQKRSGGNEKSDEEADHVTVTRG